VERLPYTLELCCRDGRVGTPARGPVGIPPEGPVGIDAIVGPDDMEGEGVCGGFAVGVLSRVVTGGTLRLGGAAPHAPVSALLGRSPAKEPLPPRINPPPPREVGTKPRGPDGGIAGPLFSGRLWAEIDTGALVEWTGAVKFLPPLGPVGALKPAGPRGGDRAIDLAGERSRGVDLVESLSLSLYANCREGERVRCGGGERSRGGDLVDSSLLYVDGDLALIGGDLAR
jgi:hypothetical protein